MRGPEVTMTPISLSHQTFPRSRSFIDAEILQRHTVNGSTNGITSVQSSTKWNKQTQASRWCQKIHIAGQVLYDDSCIDRKEFVR